MTDNSANMFFSVLNQLTYLGESFGEPIKKNHCGESKALGLKTG